MVTQVRGNRGHQGVQEFGSSGVQEFRAASPSARRIIDVNLNRLTEALKLIEDFCRFELGDRKLLRVIRRLRVSLDQIVIPLRGGVIPARRSECDLGRGSEFDSTGRGELRDVLFASLKRVQESARILEELTRLEKGEGRREKGESGLAPVFKALRFFGYDLEGSIRRRLDRDIVRKDGRPLLCVVMDMDTIGKKGEGRREKAARHQELAGIARELCRNKVDMIQLREPKDLPTREFLRDARAIQGAIRGEKGEGRKEKGESGEGVRFIVNDRVDIALAVGSDGVHLGQGDMPVAEARRLLPANVVIGISVETAEQARCAEQGGADYLGVGAIFATPSKSDVRVIGLAGLRAIRKATRREATRLPIIAIGGVNANNAGRAVRAGAAGIAVISAVFAGGAIRRNVAELRRELGTKHKEALRRFVWVKSA